LNLLASWSGLVPPYIADGLLPSPRVFHGLTSGLAFLKPGEPDMSAARLRGKVGLFGDLSLSSD